MGKQSSCSPSQSASAVSYTHLFHLRQFRHFFCLLLFVFCFSYQKAYATSGDTLHICRPVCRADRLISGFIILYPNAVCKRFSRKSDQSLRHRRRERPMLPLSLIHISPPLAQSFCAAAALFRYPPDGTRSHLGKQPTVAAAPANRNARSLAPDRAMWYPICKKDTCQVKNAKDVYKRQVHHNPVI